MLLNISLSILLVGMLRSATPLIFDALGGLLSERSGIVQIALEGFMLFGALIAATVTYFTHSPWLGFLSGGFGSLLLALFFAFFVIKLKSNQIITGMAINILIAGSAPFITKILFDSTGSTPTLDIAERFTYEPIVVCALAALYVFYLIHKTRMGLWIAFAGESAEALSAAGISVKRTRYLSLCGTGFLSGLGGATLSLALASSYSPMMTAGRGFMALAALIFGKWKPLPTLMTCLFFAFIDALQIQLQNLSSEVPIQFIQIIPYVITILALSGFFGKSQAPKMLGNE